MSKMTMPRSLWNELRPNRTLEEMAALTELYRHEREAYARWERAASAKSPRATLLHARLMKARDAYTSAVKATAY
jgi:hypothetical protein